MTCTSLTQLRSNGIKYSRLTLTLTTSPWTINQGCSLHNMEWVNLKHVLAPEPFLTGIAYFSLVVTQEKVALISMIYSSTRSKMELGLKSDLKWLSLWTTSRKEWCTLTVKMLKWTQVKESHLRQGPIIVSLGIKTDFTFMVAEMKFKYSRTSTSTKF